MRNEILEYFRKANGNYVSGEQISRDLNVSRTAIWKHINALKEEGYTFESSSKLGYKLIALADKIINKGDVGEVVSVDGKGAQGSYDAIRVYLWIGMMHDADPP